LYKLTVDRLIADRRLVAVEMFHASCKKGGEIVQLELSGGW